jgi:hypothetical protein
MSRPCVQSAVAELIGPNTMTTDSYEPVENRPRPIRNALIIALLAFVIGAALVTWALTQWKPARQLIAPKVAATTTAPSMTTVPAPMVTLTSQPASPMTPETVAVTESRVSGLEARLAQIDAQAANASNNAARAEGLLIAFAVRRAIDRGVGLGYLEGQLRERFADTQPRAVGAIISAAQAPVTLDALRQQLEVIAPTLSGGGPDESWGAAAQRALGSLFIVRKASTPSPAPDDRVARALLALDGGQVDTALAEVARLPSRGSATDWMAAARRYVEANRALDILEAAALTAPQAAPRPAPAISPPPATTGPALQ